METSTSKRPKLTTTRVAKALGITKTTVVESADSALDQLGSLFRGYEARLNQVCGENTASELRHTRFALRWMMASGRSSASFDKMMCGLTLYQTLTLIVQGAKAAPGRSTNERIVAIQKRLATLF